METPLCAVNLNVQACDAKKGCHSPSADNQTQPSVRVAHQDGVTCLDIALRRPRTQALRHSPEIPLSSSWRRRYACQLRCWPLKSVTHLRKAWSAKAHPLVRRTVRVRRSDARMVVQLSGRPCWYRVSAKTGTVNQGCWYQA